MYTTKPSTIYYTQASDRLLFRSMNLSDLPNWVPFFNDADYHQYLGQDLTIPLETRARIWIERQVQRKSENEYGQLAIIEKASGKLIGLGGIIVRDIKGNIEYEVTYSILPRYWGNGYATELAQHFRDYARENIPIKSVISMIHPENNASIKVAEKNDMSLAGEHTFFEMPVLVYRHTYRK